MVVYSAAQIELQMQVEYLIFESHICKAKEVVNLLIKALAPLHVYSIVKHKADRHVCGTLIKVYDHHIIDFILLAIHCLELTVFGCLSICCPSIAGLQSLVLRASTQICQNVTTMAQVLKPHSANSMGR